MSLPSPTATGQVVVTGASSGIGAHLARELARRGYRLCLVARRRDRLDELASELEESCGVPVDCQVCDLADSSERDAFIARLRASHMPVIGLCNNAGLGWVGRFVDQPSERGRQQLRVNVEALHELTRALVDDMLARGQGAILNTSSTASFQPLPHMATYAATKAFVSSLSEALHAELAGTKVSCTALCPGVTETEFQNEAGFGEASERLPALAVMSAADVAKAGVEGMIAGQRSVVPGVINRLQALGGHYAPRTALLPLLRLGAQHLG